jgi:hypothetical protein
MTMKSKIQRDLIAALVNFLVIFALGAILMWSVPAKAVGDEFTGFGDWSLKIWAED